MRARKSPQPLPPPSVEAEARRLLREQIERTPWFRGIPKDERHAKIEHDVDRFWHLKAIEAERHIADQLLQGSGPRKAKP